MPVRRAVVVALAALLIAALLDAEGLERTARSQPFGWRHDVATAVVRPVVAVSRALHLTAPRAWLLDVLDRPGGEPDASPPPTSSTTSTTGTTTPGTTGSTSGPSSTSSTSTSTTVPLRRGPTASDPLRLLIVGDSMTEAFGPELDEAAVATGVVTVARLLRYSSGLTRPDFFDWPAQLASLLAEHDPEAVVVMMGANDAQGIRTPSGTADFGTDAWIAEYRSRVASVMTMLDDGERTVYWIGLPVMRSGSFDDRMALISGIYEEEAANHRGVRFVGTRELFSDGGGYAAYLPGADGQPVLVRRDDGIHLTSAGGQRLAAAVLAVIEEDWELG
jgi:hypothetical protein